MSWIPPLPDGQRPVREDVGDGAARAEGQVPRRVVALGGPDDRPDDEGADEEHDPEAGEDPQESSPHELEHVGAQAGFGDEVPADGEEPDDGETAERLLIRGVPQERRRPPAAEREGVVDDDRGREQQPQQTQGVAMPAERFLQRHPSHTPPGPPPVRRLLGL